MWNASEEEAGRYAQKLADEAREVPLMTLNEATAVLADPQKRHSGPFVHPEIKKARRVVARAVVRRRELTEGK